MSAIQSLIAAHRQGHPVGLYSVCCSNEQVLLAAMQVAQRYDTLLLIEATSNQVDQFGGYTGMTPQQYRDYVLQLASSQAFPVERLILGGDHLGPNPWRSLPAEEALAKAEIMVAAYVAAGFTKIHLDASMGCAGEPEGLDDETTARRAARLARVAEATAAGSGLTPPVYIIGTEVPTPGGALHDLDDVPPTLASAARKTVATHRRVFAEQGLTEAFARVIGLVVQPGVEFGHDKVVVYRPERARDLIAVLQDEPQFVFEAHSTDYQPEAALAALVRDGFPILKVGPGLTFALRQTLYGLDLIASHLDASYGGRALANAMEGLMLAEPNHWQRYYPGTADEQHVLRHYSYSDRIRYYWPHEQADRAVARLMATLKDRIIPEPLVAQFLPEDAEAVRRGECAATAEALLERGIGRMLQIYGRACNPA